MSMGLNENINMLFLTPFTSRIGFSCLAFLPFISLIFAEPVVAIRVTNKAEVFRAEPKHELLLFGMKADQGDTIITHENSQVQLRYQSGTIITIEANAQLILAASAPDNKKVKGNWGKFNFDVKNRDGKSKFKVETPLAMAGTEGTVFSVHVDRESGATRVFLYKGAVRVFSIGDQRGIVLQPGYYLTVRKSGGVPKPEPIPPEFQQKQDKTIQGEEGKAEDVEAPEVKEVQQEQPAIEQPGAKGNERIYLTGQNASAGFISQDGSERKEQSLIAPPSTKDKSKVIIEIQK